MSNAAALLASVFVGAAFGAGYLGLLWLAVRRLAQRGGARVFVALAVLRAALLIAMVAGGLILGASAAQIAGWTLGFIAVRFLATRIGDPRNAAEAPWK